MHVQIVRPCLRWAKTPHICVASNSFQTTDAIVAKLCLGFRSGGWHEIMDMYHIRK